jgi:acetyl esterase/lipase
MFDTLSARGDIEIVDLWNGNCPHFDPTLDQKLPRLAVYPPHAGKPVGSFIIAAGGAHMFKSYNEAMPVADYFYQKGFHAAIIDYRVNPYTEEDSCADGCRAVQYLRAHAAKYNIRPDKIAFGGFSAGGMLTGQVATRFTAGNPDAADPVERVSSRPDAALQIYGSFDGFESALQVGTLGYRPEVQQQKAAGSTVLRVRSDCPPFFLMETSADDPRSLLQMAQALANYGVPMAIHLFQQGDHGQGLYNGEYETQNVPHTARWAELAAEWLEDLGFTAK